ncbi:terpenoid synthase [Cylindrobasidium torrendii FP15055 ss-10]|uniref:Terpene synthase n=1 Tax=Cylindrobasidium torrendii FP15055 ss-10 TaxID=1314674 RepID=A0A0D7BG15_9AGAR|nr:terpenoid synthase [Cylindrobasidium torrendii FP15055 ss-10]
MSLEYTIPDLLANWPFRTQVNPHATRLNADSLAWVESYNVFDRTRQATFNSWDFGAFSALAYPHLNPAQYRAAVDLLNLYFVYDELSDVADAGMARFQSDSIMKALKDPFGDSPADEHVLGAMTRDFWQRCLRDGNVAHSSADRFVKAFEKYTDGVVIQAADRDKDVIRSIDEYIAVRRDTVGCLPSYSFLILSDDIPNEIMEHPVVQALTQGSIDLSILANDIHSFNVEQAHGDKNHNIVSVIMAQDNCDVQTAIDEVVRRYDIVVQDFLAVYASVPQIPIPDASLRKVVERYCELLGAWVTTNEEWSYITPRYFGAERQAVKETRKVKLLPRKV